MVLRVKHGPSSKLIIGTDMTEDLSYKEALDQALATEQGAINSAVTESLKNLTKIASLSHTTQQAEGKLILDLMSRVDKLEHGQLVLCATVAVQAIIILVLLLKEIL
jgi:hypothetical protein